MIMIMFLHVNCNTVNHFGQKCALNYYSEQILQFPESNLVLCAPPFTVTMQHHELIPFSI